MLKRFLGGAPQAPQAPTVDLPRLVKFSGDPVVERWAKRAQGGDWAGLEAFLQGVQDVEQRDIYLSEITGELDGRPIWIDQWVASRPGDFLALVFRGNQYVDWAWQAHGGRWASQVPAGAFRLFFYRLGLARQDLEAAAQIAPPGDPGALVPQIPMGIGLDPDLFEIMRSQSPLGLNLNFDRPDLMQIWNEIQQRRPWHELAVFSMVKALAPKWGGSLPAMFDFAKTTADAPEGSSAHLAPVMAHYEAFLEQGAVSYWQRPDVREDILVAAERSIQSPAFVSSPDSLRYHNWFLYAFGRIKEWDLFVRELNLVQGRLTSPWERLKDPVGIYNQMRQEMARATGGATARF